MRGGKDERQKEKMLKPVIRKMRKTGVDGKRMIEDLGSAGIEVREIMNLKAGMV